MIPSSGGRFEVMRDGQPLFDKTNSGRHARPGEILELLAAP